MPNLADDLQDFQNTVTALITNGFRFSVIHNPDERRLQIVSATKPDHIKVKFPDFNIYFGAGNQKIVDKTFVY